MLRNGSFNTSCKYEISSEAIFFYEALTLTAGGIDTIIDCCINQKQTLSIRQPTFTLRTDELYLTFVLVRLFISEQIYQG